MGFEMALVVCRQCKKAFISGPGDGETCSACIARLRKLYPLVRNFLRDNDRGGYTAQDVSRIMNVSLEDVVALISLGFMKLK